MVSPPRTIVGVVALLGTLGLALSQGPAEPASRLQTGSPPQVIGMAGCAATGCHGRPEAPAGASDLWHESFSRWIDRDPHTRAYDVLDSPLGKAIMKNLTADKAKPPPSATTDARCIACHANPSLADKDAMADPRLDRLRSEGVSCEACHGNAEYWQIAHTNWTNPNTRTADFAKHGMTDLNDWSTQARTCVGCHIGAPAGNGYPVRDMNHDMIAAGHPRLEFEFVTFHQKLSPHWLPKHRGSAETNLGKQSLLQAWLVGQVVTEQAYCELSLDRLARGTSNVPRSPLPEFADWNCSQCHHGLVSPVPELRAKPPAGGRKIGHPVWIGESGVLPTVAMPQFGQPPKVQQDANQKRWDKLEELRKALVANPKAELRTQLQAVLGREVDKTLNWEEAARQYLAIHSLDTAMRPVVPAVQAFGDDLGRFRVALWGKAEPPTRREFTDKSTPGYKGYQRKPESRWTWEKPGQEWKPVGEIVAALRKSLAARLQNLPP